MAFSDTEKVKIVTDLGWPGLTVVPDSIYYSNWVNDRLNTVTLPIERCVRDLMGRLEKMDEKLEKAVCRAGVEKVDGITFNKDEIRILRKERNKIICEMSMILDIPMQACGGGMGNVSI